VKGHLTVFASDAIARDNTKFTPGALASVLAQVREVGNPTFLSHDMHRPIGWNQATALYLEPGLARLCGFVHFAETADEGKQLVHAVGAWYDRQVAGHQQHVQTLRTLADDAVHGKGSIVIAECVALHNAGVARRLCPKVFALEDDDGLIEVQGLDRIGPGVYRLGEFALFAHHYFRRALPPLNSLNSPFLTELENLDPALRPRISLDPDLIGLAATRRPVIEHEYWWGPQFGEDLAAIEPGLVRHEASEGERMYHGISRTEFWWQSRKGEHIFEVEEVRDRETFSAYGGTYGCRYAHAVVSEATGTPSHFDGAIRTYTDERMVERLEVKLTEVRRDLPYHKLWRIDGDIPVATWKRLLSDYYRDNHLVGEYLGAPPEARLGNMRGIRGAADPHSMAVGQPKSRDERLPIYSGPRAVLSWHSHLELTEDRQVIPFRSIDGRAYVEMQTLNAVKQMRRLGASVWMADDVAVISPDDFYYNIAPIWHRNVGAVSMTIVALRRLVAAWEDRGIDAVVSLALGVPSEDADLLIALAGPIGDVKRVLAEWSRRVQPLLPQPEAISNALSELFAEWPATTDDPALLAVPAQNGLAEIPRVYLDGTEFEMYIPEGSSSLAATFSIDIDRRPWVAEGLESRRLAGRLAWLDEGDRCARCGELYRSCPCSVWIDDDCFVIVKGSPALAFVTDRPADSQTQAAAPPPPVPR
jgi:hypothetical protein